MQRKCWAECIICLRYSRVWNDDGYTNLPGGGTKHLNPLCRECSKNKTQLSFQWDGIEQQDCMNADAPTQRGSMQ